MGAVAGPLIDPPVSRAFEEVRHDARRRAGNALAVPSPKCSPPAVLMTGCGGVGARARPGP